MVGGWKSVMGVLYADDEAGFLSRCRILMLGQVHEGGIFAVVKVDMWETISLL
jgi:hypothetical protein